MNGKQILVIKANGEREPFDIEKLERSLVRAHASEAAIKHVTHHVLQEVEDGTSTHDIYKHAFKLLHEFDNRTALKYSMRRAISELGPSGFPFEKIIAEVFKQQGYETLTDQIVLGGCVSHEVDVVAWKGDELIMSEVKFHGQPGLKSDLKVVLYVKARFEDLAKTSFDYAKNGKSQMLTEGCLVTNTKFTTSAIKYAECQGLKVIGWNYPVGDNLHDLIDKANLHPITMLHTLSDHDKKVLLDKGIVVCSAISNNPALLEENGLTEAHKDAVLEEISLLTNSPDQKLDELG